MRDHDVEVDVTVRPGVAAELTSAQEDRDGVRYLTLQASHPPVDELLAYHPRSVSQTGNDESGCAQAMGA